MKLNVILYKGYLALINPKVLQNPQIGDIVFDNDYDDGIIYKVDQGFIEIGKEAYSVVCAEKELNLNLPVVPNLKRFFVEEDDFRKALSELASKYLCSDGSINGPSEAYNWIESKIKSFYKLPKSVFIEFENDYEEPEGDIIVPKTVINSEGYRECIIKSVIY